MMTPAEIKEWWNGPALRPPQGVTPEFLHPPNANLLHIIIVTICFILTTLAVSMRLYTKCRVIRQLLIEDCGSSTPMKPLL